MMMALSSMLFFFLLCLKIKHQEQIDFLIHLSLRFVMKSVLMTHFSCPIFILRIPIFEILCTMGIYVVNAHSFLTVVEHDVIIVLEKLSVIFIKIVEIVHVTECIHSLLNLRCNFQNFMLVHRSLPMVFVSHNPIVDVPYLECEYELHLTVRVKL